MSDNVLRFLVLSFGLPLWIFQWVIIYLLMRDISSLREDLRKLAPPSPSHKESRDADD